MDYSNPYARFGVNMTPMNQMGYQGPMWNTPVPQQSQPQGPQLIRVTGIDGAKAYQMGPNAVVPLFDADNDIMYVKSTDGAGFPTIRTFAFTPVEQTAQPSADYVTRDEFDTAVAKIREMITHAEQPISAEQPTAKPKQSDRYQWPGAGDEQG